MTKAPDATVDRRAKRLADLLAAAERLAWEASALLNWTSDPDNFNDFRLEAALADYRTARVFWLAEGR